MRIEEIHIDGFGVWHNRCWKGLAPGLNVFLGPNEAGKTTLMNFVRSVLFGFERRSQPTRYEPLRGGTHGGRLVLAHHRRRVEIERTTGRHVRGDVRVQILGRDPREGPVESESLTLDALLSGTTRTLYHNVFAFGLEELDALRTLENTEVASYVSGAGMGIGASRWTAVWKDLEERRSRLFLPRGQKTAINAALRELEAVRSRIDRTAEEPEEYARAVERRTALESEIAGEDRRVQSLVMQVSRYEKLRRYEPHRRRRAEILDRLENADPESAVDVFPEGGVERLNLLLHQRRKIDDERSRCDSEVEQIQGERIVLERDYSPQRLLSRRRILDTLRSALPRLESIDENLTKAGEAVRSLESQKTEARIRRERAAPPPNLVLAGFAGAVGVLVAVLFVAGNLVAATGVAVLVSLIVLWSQGRRRRAREIDREIDSIADRLSTAAGERVRLELDRERILDVVEAETRRREVSPDDIERIATELDELSAIAERIRAMEASLRSAGRHRQAIEDRRVENERSIDALLQEAGATNESDFFRRAEVHRERAALRAELERIPRVDPEPGPGEGLPSAEGKPGPEMTGDDYREASAQLEAARERLNALRNEEGRLEERLEQLSMSGERTAARAKQESILASIDQAAEDWAVLTLCRTLLEETRRIYESDRQPEVLKRASGFISRMSGGRWVRVVSRLGSADIVVEASNGERVPPENLSRGTAEQLYLSMRLALVEEYARHVDALPVIFDDIFVNFDPERTRRAIEAVTDLAPAVQVLVFTCHPHVADIAREVVPTAPILTLE